MPKANAAGFLERVVLTFQFDWREAGFPNQQLDEWDSGVRSRASLL